MQDSSFWREKFRRENLPLLEEGNNSAEWEEIYRKSQRAARKVDKSMLSGDPIIISLTSVDDPKILLPLGRTEEIMRYWEIMHNSAHIQRSGDYRTIHGYTLDFFPGTGVSRYELLDKYRTETPQRLPRDSYMPRRYVIPTKIKILDGTVSTEDLWFILFQLAYFRRYIL
ncbi:hypothetical protein BQ9231_00371 [Cedratvirus lausannensis]|uniref:Uncharacterized protein n=1 Tax=Cedratvirus lausannensis TaxID=2023205 RepID=A0A285PX92_9VIRU|nr:hypothetical protein BQ9231_00371 [Cedratvirus lausannensis]